MWRPRGCLRSTAAEALGRCSSALWKPNTTQEVVKSTVSVWVSVTYCTSSTSLAILLSIRMIMSQKLILSVKRRQGSVQAQLGTSSSPLAGEAGPFTGYTWTNDCGNFVVSRRWKLNSILCFTVLYIDLNNALFESIQLKQKKDSVLVAWKCFCIGKT